MPSPAWYNDNQFRDYPFIPRTYPVFSNAGEASESLGDPVLLLPRSAILDFGGIMDLDAKFDDAAGHTVYLYAVQKHGSLLTFRFRTTSPAAANEELVFHREVTAPEFTITWEYASSITPEPVTWADCSHATKWSGFLVTGDLTELADLLIDGESQEAPENLWQIEPARIQTLAKGYLRAVHLANTPRTQTTPLPECGETPDPDTDAVLAATCISGDLILKEGFNCAIRQDTTTNALIINAGVGLGSGQPCEEVPLTEDEASPDGGTYLSGGPACNQILKAVNGISGADLTLVPGPGFRISPSGTNPHKLIVTRDFGDTGGFSSSISIGGDMNDDIVTHCLSLDLNTKFGVDLLSGVLLDPHLQVVRSVTCVYSPAMSIHGKLVWASPTVVVNKWDNGTFCGIRWRAKVICDGTNLRVEILGYPMADNTVCTICFADIQPPYSFPFDQEIGLFSQYKTRDCMCFQNNLVTHIQLRQI